jgi:uncharacterized protein
MRFLAFGDLHQDLQDLERVKKKIKKVEIDCIICLGDFTIFSNYTKEVLELINDLGKRTLLIHGNHEDEKEIEKLCKKFPNIEFAHKKIITIEGVTFLCYGGGGFAEREPEFRKFVKEHNAEIKEKNKLVLVTHAPPLNSALDEVGPDWHVGVRDYADFIEKYSPIVALSGHIHETFKRKQVKNKTLLVNPGGDGEVFEL